jgi:hypothetical protein
MYTHTCTHVLKHRNAWSEDVDIEEEERYAKEHNITRKQAREAAKAVLGQPNPRTLGPEAFKAEAREIFGSASDAEELLKEVFSEGVSKEDSGATQTRNAGRISGQMSSEEEDEEVDSDYGGVYGHDGLGRDILAPDSYRVEDGRHGSRNQVWHVPASAVHVCLYVCVYMYIYIHTHIYMYVHTNTHTHIHVYMIKPISIKCSNILNMACCVQVKCLHSLLCFHT